MCDIQRSVFEFTVSQITALNSTPLTLLPAQTGHAYFFTNASLMRNGTRYLAQPGALQLRVPGQNVLYVAFATNMLTDTTSSATRSAEHRIQTAVGFAGDAANQYGSKGVEFFCATGNPTVDGTNTGAPVILAVWYRLMPTYYETLGTLWRSGPVGLGRF